MFVSPLHNKSLIFPAYVGTHLHFHLYETEFYSKIHVSVNMVIYPAEEGVAPGRGRALPLEGDTGMYGTAVMNPFLQASRCSLAYQFSSICRS